MGDGAWGVGRRVVQATWFFTVGAVIAWLVAASHDFEGTICYGGDASGLVCDGVGFEDESVLWLAPVVIVACAVIRAIARRAALKIIAADVTVGFVLGQAAAIVAVRVGGAVVKGRLWRRRAQGTSTRRRARAMTAGMCLWPWARFLR
ncbi:hypothetical protein GCM10022206_37240 [Streptomyces chiangmaiensis]